MRLSLAALALLAAMQSFPAAARDGVAGAYLAARQASLDYDYAKATEYYTRALMGDPSNALFLEFAIVAHVATGNAERARPMVEQIGRLGLASQGAAMVRFADLSREGDYAGILAELEGGTTLGPLVDGLLRAWALIGSGQMSDAIAAFDALGTEPDLLPFALYHKALALASVGDFEGADAILSGAASGPLRATRRSLLAHVAVLSQLERNPDALDLITAVAGTEPDPEFAALSARLRAGEPVPFDVVTGARDGLAEVFFTIAGALNSETPDGYALGYSRLAEYIRPDHTEAALLSAAMLEAQGQFALATEAYKRVPPEDPAFALAEIGRAQALLQSEKPDAAIEVLENLSKSHPELATVWTNLGDAFRREDRFEEAAAAYDRAVETFAAPAPAQWVVYYTRGVAHERLGDWPSAEADFRKALALNPDQPQVLNYLGYSFVEKKTNLDEALDMIERAVRAEPESGHIVDSLGWALYRLGRYDEAVPHMERAVELLPIDPVVNDHLGDVYWAVGRKREAEFQWKRALSFLEFDETQDVDPDRIRRKLEVGLDTVLQEEGAPPLTVSENGN